MVRSDTESCISPLGNEHGAFLRGCDGSVVQFSAVSVLCSFQTCMHSKDLCLGGLEP